MRCNLELNNQKEIGEVLVMGDILCVPSLVVNVPLFSLY